MSFGFSVSDITAISRLAFKVYTKYKDAPGDYRNISDEVKALHIIIDNAAEYFKIPTLSDNKRQEGQEVLRSCQNLLEDLDSLVGKYNGLASASKGTSSGQVLQKIKLGAGLVLGTEDIATLRARLTSNIALLSTFIQSCDSLKLDKMQGRLDTILGLHRTTSKDSIVSLAASNNTKKAYKKFIKDLFEIGVTADMINEKKKEIKSIFEPQQAVASNQMDDSISENQGHQLPQVGGSSNAEVPPISTTSWNQSELPVVGNSSDAEASPISTTFEIQSQLPEVGNSSEAAALPVPTSFEIQNQLPEVENSSDAEALPVSTTSGVQSQLPEVGNSSDARASPISTTFGVQSQLPEVGNSSDAKALPMISMPKPRSRFGQIRTPVDIDFLVGPRMLAAAEVGDTKRLTSALRYVRNINFADDRNRTALHKAATEGHRDIVQLLLPKGASVGALDFSRNTPMHSAAYYGYTSTVELLLMEGAPVEAKNKDNNTPLHHAALCGHTSTVELLLTKGASVESMGTLNQTPLHHAALCGHTRTVELLLTKGASVGAMDFFNQTPLHNGAHYGHTSTVELLLTKGASVETTDSDGNTPLHHAARYGYTGIVKLLLANGASIKALNNRNNTPLHYAISCGHIDIIELIENKDVELAILANNFAGF